MPAASNLDSRDRLGLVAILLVTTIVFANGITGEFVHDDNRQIVRNDLIRDPHRWPDALRHDIWSFLGERGQPWSNYWRPGHVAWLILNFQLFGAASPVGWHITSLLAHLGVIVCAYALLRQLGMERAVTTAIVAIFAVHPTRAESVTWIAGVHDVICTLWQLCALLLLMSIWRDRHPSWGKWIAAVLLYALAVFTKEIAIFFPVIVAFIRLTDPAIASQPRSARIRHAVLAATPFACLAMVFLVARYLVLGHMQIPFTFRPTTASVVATLPLVIVTYLRQMVFPYWIGWTYPVRAVTGANLSFANFWLPILILTVIVAILARVRWDRLRLIGATLFALSLLPALNLYAFPPDNLVKDRFLYLPLLGFLIFLIPTLADLGRRWPKLCTGAAAVTVLLLALQTIRYNFAWRSDVALWSWAVRNDPGSAVNHRELAVALIDVDRLDEAHREIDRAIAMMDDPNSYMALADLNMKRGKFSDAAAAAKRALDLARDSKIVFAAYERLAAAYEKMGSLNEAEQTLREAREKVPFRRAYFTDELAVILYQRGDRAAALTELEAARDAAEAEFSPTARLVIFHLGMLYNEIGREADGRATLEKFLRLTEGTADPMIVSARQTARAALGQPNLP